MNAPAAGSAPATPADNSDGAAITVVAATTIWGIDEDGDLIFSDDQAPDSYREIEDSKDFNIPRYPLESGGFESYNKVEQPGEVHLALMVGGTDARRQTFRHIIDDLASSTRIVDILTPSRTYTSYNLIHVDAQRSADSGAQLLTLRLTFQEIRTTVVAAFSNVLDPSAAANTNGGAVQAAPATPAQTPPAQVPLKQPPAAAPAPNPAMSWITPG